MKHLIQHKLIARLKHKKTYDILHLIDLNESDEKIIQAIEKASIDDLIKKVPECYKKNKEFKLGLCLTNDSLKKAIDLTQSILNAILTHSNEKVLKAFLNQFKDDKDKLVIRKILNDYFHLPTLLENEKLDTGTNNLIEMTDLLIEYGFDLNWKTGTVPYLYIIIEHSVVEKGNQNYVISQPHFDLLKHLIANKGLITPWNEGVEISSSIATGNQEVLDYILSTKMTSVIGLEKAVNNFYENYAKLPQYNEKKLRLANYVEAYIEKIKIETQLELMESMPEKIAKKKVKI
jgi:hypothetical protein